MRLSDQNTSISGWVVIITVVAIAVVDVDVDVVPLSQSVRLDEWTRRTDRRRKIADFGPQKYETDGRTGRAEKKKSRAKGRVAMRVLEFNSKRETWREGKLRRNVDIGGVELGCAKARL